MSGEPPVAPDPGRPIRVQEPGGPWDAVPDQPDGPPSARPPGAEPPPGVEPPLVAEPGAPALPQHQIRRTRTGALWVAVTAAALVLLLLLIFILQNGRQVQVSFFGADGHLPLGVAMLLSAVAGALLVALLGTARIVQLRLVARRHRSVDAVAGRWPRRRSARETSETGPVQRRP